MSDMSSGFGTLYTNEQGAVHFKGLVYCPDTNEELSCFGRDNKAGFTGAETILLGGNNAAPLSRAFAVNVGTFAAADAVKQTPNESIEGLASFRKHANSRNVHSTDIVSLMKEEKWFDMFGTLVNVAAYGSFLQIIIATKKHLNFMRLQGMSAYDQEEPYKTPFLINHPVSWYEGQEYSISIARIMLRIANLLLLRCLYPKMEDVVVVAKQYAAKVLMLAMPAAEWLDLKEGDECLSDVDVANYCVGQQTLYFIKKFGASLLHPRDALKARMIHLLCSSKFMGHPGSLVREAELANIKMSRGLVLPTYQCKDKALDLLSAYSPATDFPEVAKLRNVVAVAEAGARGGSASSSSSSSSRKGSTVLRSSEEHKKTAQLWNKLFTDSSNSNSSTGNDNGNGNGGGRSSSSGSSSSSSNKINSNQSAESAPATDDDDVLNRPLVTQRSQRVSETTYLGVKVGIFKEEVITQYKLAKLAKLRRQDDVEQPYPQAILDIVYEKYCVARGVANVCCRTSTWKHKDCGFCMQYINNSIAADDHKAGLAVLVCRECVRPFHQQCAAAAAKQQGWGEGDKGRPQVLVGDIQYLYLCQDCAILARNSNSLHEDGECIAPHADHLKRVEHSLVDAAVVGLTTLMVQHNFKYFMFDVRALWAIISKRWASLQPLVLVMSDTRSNEAFLPADENRSVSLIPKSEAKERLLAVLRGHPIFQVKNSQEEGRPPVVGLVDKFREVVMHTILREGEI